MSPEQRARELFLTISRMGNIAVTGGPVEDKVVLAIATAIREAEDAAYLAGFNYSGEGWNGEFPFRDYGREPQADEGWLSDREMNLGRTQPLKSQEP